MVVAERVGDEDRGGTTDRPAVARHTARQLQTQVCRIHRIISKWTGLYETQNYGYGEEIKPVNAVFDNEQNIDACFTISNSGIRAEKLAFLWVISR